MITSLVTRSTQVDGSERRVAGLFRYDERDGSIGIYFSRQEAQNLLSNPLRPIMLVNKTTGPRSQRYYGAISVALAARNALNKF